MSGGNSRRQPDLYWKAFKQVKTSAIYMRMYRNRLARWVRSVEILRAVASSTAIAGWAVWNQAPFLWASIIALAQVADALKGVLPFAKLHRAASDLTVAMETICIDAEDEWESIYVGDLPEDEIRKRRTKLRKLVAAAEKKHFPDGFETSRGLAAMASAEAEDYFRMTFAEESAHDALADDTEGASDPEAAASAGSESALIEPPRAQQLPDLQGERAHAERHG